MTDRQTNIQTSGNDNKAHSLRDVTQQTEWNNNKAHFLRDVTQYNVHVFRFVLYILTAVSSLILADD